MLARKTPKQCKARWAEWLDPGIRKIEWSKDEDEKLLHLAKLMPTQWRTIAPIVGRTATQCLERYQKLLDEAEARENDELGLGGPDGGETQAPSADDVRRLRPGELDPDPESKPARPDTIDLDEDEKEMLSEARARLANTQGKKAKRKARERQLEESRRLAVLQKRRELKNAGINIKVVTRKAGQMDYNADIPFEKAPAAGFFDTQTEESLNEREREAFDPRKQQLANKRKGDQQDDGDDRGKKRKNDRNAPTAASAAAAKAGQMQKIREAERNSKRRALVLPAPQVSESELEDIVKMGLAGERATISAGSSDNAATRGLIGNYTNMVGSTPLRTPRAPQEEDRVANEIRNARARTETQSALLGGENTPLHEGQGTTGYNGATPRGHVPATPNPMSTVLRSNAGKALPSATPLRTPRDNFRLNDQTPLTATMQTPRDVRNSKTALQQKLAALPRPQETAWDLELPTEQQEPVSDTASSAQSEDAAVRDARALAQRQAAAAADAKRQTQVVQRALPRPQRVDVAALLAAARARDSPAERAVAEEAAWLVAHDARAFGAASVHGPSRTLERMPDEALAAARAELAREDAVAAAAASGATRAEHADVTPALRIAGLAVAYDGSACPPLDTDDDASAQQLAALSATRAAITASAAASSAAEKKLAPQLAGYATRNRSLRAKAVQAAEALARVQGQVHVSREALAGEQAAIAGRLESLREEVAAVLRRERVAQEEFARTRAQLEELS